MVAKKKLIEVALPLEAINVASAREKSIRHGHPSTLHLWWARRPLAAARAVIFAQMVDDPSAHPERFPTEEAQEQERQRLFRIIEDLVLWENTTNETVLQQARDEIWKSWRYTCSENAGSSGAKDHFDPNLLPAFHDPFAGGGTLPLEAQRLGLKSYATDLNPVAVLICKAMIEIPPKFADKPPVAPASGGNQALLAAEWRGARGLAEDVRYYGQWLRNEATKRIGHLYPKAHVTAEMANDRPDLKKYVGKKLPVIAWLWVRTVKSPNPAFADVDIPLASTFVLSTKSHKEAYVEPVVEGRGYYFTVKRGHAEGAKNGTKLARGSFRCLLSTAPVDYSYIDDEANAGRMGARLMATVAEGEDGRVYLPPTVAMEAVAREAHPTWKPDAPSRGTWASNAQGRRYGFKTFGDYFTPRQLVALTTFSDLVAEVSELVKHDAIAAGFPDDGKPLANGGVGATAYADAVRVYLAIAVDKAADYNSTVCSWISGGETLRNTFGRQAIPMVWDYCEANAVGEATGSINSGIRQVAKALEVIVPGSGGAASQCDAQSGALLGRVVSTDPPYYDNIGYADLSDYFYVWLRRALQSIFPELFATVAVPKAEELVACSYRHDGRENAEAFFLDGMTVAVRRLAEHAGSAFPVTIYYAFKQAESDDEGGTASTGWDTFLDAVIRAGFMITGTWPIRTERGARSVSIGTNALASSIILVCRQRPGDALAATRRDFVSALKAELPVALANLQRGNIAPVDLAQAAIGPGMAIYSRFARVLDAEGKPLSVRAALSLINRTLDETLAEQEADFDSDSRWALAWFGDHGFEEGPFGDAHTYFLRFNTAENGLVSAGIIKVKVTALCGTEHGGEQTSPRDAGSPAKLMISASWPQDLGYSPATVASGCGEKLVFIESAGDP